MYKWFTSFVVVLVGVSLAGLASLAGSEKRVASAGNASKQKLGAVEAGGATGRLSALRQAAGRGDLDAQLELAGKYAAGKTLPGDQLKAFRLYQDIVDAQAEIHPRDVRAGRVASAFVALGDYFRNGISGTAIKVDKPRAASLYWHAASYFADAEAQYNLARMHLLGEGVPRNGRLAVNWLANAAKKRHARAQAVLGDLLWRGAEGVRRRPDKGLALLTIAGQNARNAAEARWIESLRVSALEYSQEHERVAAKRLSARWQSSIGRASAVGSVPAAPEAEPEMPVSQENDTALPGRRAEGITNIGLDAGALR